MCGIKRAASRLGACVRLRHRCDICVALSNHLRIWHIDMPVASSNARACARHRAHGGGINKQRPSAINISEMAA